MSEFLGMGGPPFGGSPGFGRSRHLVVHWMGDGEVEGAGSKAGCLELEFGRLALDTG